MARVHCHTLCEPTCFMVLRFSVERGEGKTACRSGTGLAGVSPSNFEYNYDRILAEPEIVVFYFYQKNFTQQCKKWVGSTTVQIICSSRV